MHDTGYWWLEDSVEQRAGDGIQEHERMTCETTTGTYPLWRRWVDCMQSETCSALKGSAVSTPARWASIDDSIKYTRHNQNTPAETAMHPTHHAAYWASLQIRTIPHWLLCCCLASCHVLLAGRNCTNHVQACTGQCNIGIWQRGGWYKHFLQCLVSELINCKLAWKLTLS